MTRLAWLEGALALAVGLAAAPRAAEPVGERPGEATGEAAPPAARAVELVECGELWSHPSRYLGRELVLHVQFREWIASWEPYVTRFGSGEYRAFAAWGEEQFLWSQDEYDAPRARLFVRRGSAADWALEPALEYDAFELSVAVRAVFADVPWVEVLGVRPVLRRITEGSVLHGSRALELMGRRVWSLADTELERALASPLPERARLELERLREVCREERALIEERPLLRPVPR